MNIRDQIIKDGVKDITEYGYEFATRENILTNEIYKRFFVYYLRGSLNLVKADSEEHKEMQKLIEELQ